MTQNGDNITANVDDAAKKEASVSVHENGSGGDTASNDGTTEQDAVKSPGGDAIKTTAAVQAASHTRGDDDSKPATQAAAEPDSPEEQDAAAQAQLQEPATAADDTTTSVPDGGKPPSDDEVLKEVNDEAKEAEPAAEPAAERPAADSVGVEAAKGEGPGTPGGPSDPAHSSTLAEKAETAAADPLVEESTATAAEEPAEGQQQPEATSEGKEAGKHDSGGETHELPAPAPAAADDPVKVQGQRSQATAADAGVVVPKSEGHEAEAKPAAKAPEQAKDSTPETSFTAAVASAVISEKETVSVTPPGTVQALSRRLSSNALNTPPPKATTLDKPLASSGGSGAALTARASKSPTGPTKSGEVSPLSAHDTKNTINVSQLLKSGAFKMQPLKDFVPYEDLQRLRVEDGIDATRKEDYLNEPEFQQVFGMDRDAFKKLPAWRQGQAKKKANLF